MADIANLQIKVDSTQTTKAATELDKLEKQAKKTESAAKAVGGSFETVSGTMRKAQSEAQKLTETQKKLEQTQNKTTTSTNALNIAYGKAIQMVGGLVSAYSALRFIQVADQFTSLNDRIRQSTKSAEEAKSAFSGLFSSVRATGSSMEAAVSIFQRISMNRSELKASIDDMINFTDVVQKLGTLSGASPDSMKSGLTQLGQSLSSNIVRAEEFNSIMENIPAVGKQIADQFGITTGQLRNLVIDGNLLSQDVFTAILASQETVNKKFDDISDTATFAFTQMKNDASLVANEINIAWGVSSGLADTLRVSSDVLRSMAVAAATMAYSFTALAKSASIGSKGLDVKAGELYNEFSRRHGGKIGGIKLGEFDVSGREAEIKKLEEEIAKIPTFEETRNKLFPEDGKNGGTSVSEASKYAEQISAIKKQYEGVLKGISKGSGERKESSKQVADEEKKVIDNLIFQHEQLGRNSTEQAVYNELRRANVEIESQAGQKIATLVREYERQKTLTEEIRRRTDELGESLSSAFANGITGVQSWGDAARSVISSIQNMISQELAANVKNVLTGSSSSGGKGILSSVISGFGSLLGFAGGVSATSASVTQAAARGASNPALFGPGFAEGGGFTVGGNGGTDSQLVAFRASPNERVSITRPDQQGYNGSGGGNVFHIDARGASVEAIQRLEQAVLNIDRNIERRSIAAVGNSFKRDPSFGGRR